MLTASPPFAMPLRLHTRSPSKPSRPARFPDVRSISDVSRNPASATKTLQNSPQTVLVHPVNLDASALEGVGNRTIGSRIYAARSVTQADPKRGALYAWKR